MKNNVGFLIEVVFQLNLNGMVLTCPLIHHVVTPSGGIEREVCTISFKLTQMKIQDIFDLY